MSATKPIPIPTLDDTKACAERLAAHLRRGDVVTLDGVVGAGKTTFTQFLIHALSPTPVEVTSPTFTLLQTYPVQLADGDTVELHHYDLYRVEEESALVELGIDDAAMELMVVEWPERLGRYRLPVTLALHFSGGDDGARSIHITSHDPRFKDMFA